MHGRVYLHFLHASSHAGRLVQMIIIVNTCNIACTHFLLTQSQWLRETYNGNGFELPQSWTQLRIPTDKNLCADCSQVRSRNRNLNSAVSHGARLLSSCSAAQAGRQHGGGTFAGCLGVDKREVNVLVPLALVANKFGARFVNMLQKRSLGPESHLKRLPT